MGTSKLPATWAYGAISNWISIEKYKEMYNRSDVTETTKILISIARVASCIAINVLYLSEAMIIYNSFVAAIKILPYLFATFSTNKTFCNKGKKEYFNEIIRHLMYALADIFIITKMSKIILTILFCEEHVWGIISGGGESVLNWLAPLPPAPALPAAAAPPDAPPIPPAPALPAAEAPPAPENS